MNKAYIIIILCFLICVNCFCQKKYKTNLEIFDDLISTGLEKYLYYPGINRNLLFIFIVHPNDKDALYIRSGGSGGKYLKGLIKKISNEEKLKFSFADDESEIRLDSVYNRFVIRTLNLRTVYNGFAKNKFLGEKTISREIKVKISVDIISGFDSLKIHGSIEKDYNDEVNLDYYDNIESSQYEFTQATPPEAGEFESLIFPAVLVLASAGATLLFFVIRSK